MRNNSSFSLLILLLNFVQPFPQQNSWDLEFRVISPSRKQNLLLPTFLKLHGFFDFSITVLWRFGPHEIHFFFSQKICWKCTQNTLTSSRYGICTLLDIALTVNKGFLLIFDLYVRVNLPVSVLIFLIFIAS